MTTFAKWSDHWDALVLWDTETGEIHHTYTETEWMRLFGIKSDELKWAKAGYLRLDGTPTNDMNLDRAGLEELYGPKYRLNADTGRVEKYYKNEANLNPETNGAFFVPGEHKDAENGRLYGRPLPEGVEYNSLRPA